MIYPDEDGNIHCTRGDSTEILNNPLEFCFTDSSGNPFHFSAGQTCIFKVFNQKDYNDVKIQKEVEVQEDCTSVFIPLTEQDTSFGEPIQKEVKYYYEFSIEDEATLIGLDTKEKPLFILLPEGGEKND